MEHGLPERWTNLNIHNTPNSPIIFHTDMYTYIVIHRIQYKVYCIKKIETLQYFYFSSI